MCHARMANSDHPLSTLQCKATTTSLDFGSPTVTDEASPHHHTSVITQHSLLQNPHCPFFGPLYPNTQSHITLCHSPPLSSQQHVISHLRCQCVVEAPGQCQVRLRGGIDRHQDMFEGLVGGRGRSRGGYDTQNMWPGNAGLVRERRGVVSYAFGRLRSV